VKKVNGGDITKAARSGNRPVRGVRMDNERDSWRHWIPVLERELAVEMQ
jgi:hypothetical protein